MIILTGGAGFIGSVVLSALNNEGFTDILVVDEFNNSTKWKNLRGKKFKEIIQKDSLPELIEDEEITGNVEAVIHLGACTSTLEQDFGYLLDNNYDYSRGLCCWALENSIRFIYASSAATYGDGTQGFSDDEDTLDCLRPLNGYGFSKHLFDLWARDNKVLKQAVGLKFFNVFGPNEYHKDEMASLVYKAANQIKAQGSISLFKSYRNEFADGGQTRDFIYVKDVAQAILWFLENKNINGLFNLGSGVERSWNDLASAAFEAFGLEKKIKYIEMPEELRNQYQYRTKAELTKLRGVGYPIKFTPLEQAVSDYIKNYLLNDYCWL